MPSKELPLLAHLVDKLLAEGGASHDDPQFVFILIQHLLTDAPSLVRCLRHLGCADEDMHVIGVWYSTKKASSTNCASRGSTPVAQLPRRRWKQK